MLRGSPLWSGLRDLNPRSLEPKSSAIPNFAKPGYKIEDFSDVVKHVVKSHFRPQVLKSQGRKVLEPQRVFGLRVFPGTSGRSAPKSSTLPTYEARGYANILYMIAGEKAIFFSADREKAEDGFEIADLTGIQQYDMMHMLRMEHIHHPGGASWQAKHSARRYLST